MERSKNNLDGKLFPRALMADPFMLRRSGTDVGDWLERLNLVIHGRSKERSDARRPEDPCRYL
jgi:hypothetical protein